MISKGRSMGAAVLIMAQVCSVMGEGLGLLPNRALSASVRRTLLKNDSPVGIPNLLGAFSSAN
jgi:hypothetical protein